MLLVYDLGATNTRVGLVDKGVLADLVKVPTDRSKLGFAKFMGVLQEVAAGRRVNAIAGGMPFQLIGEDGEVAVANNLPEWDGLRIKAGIRELFDCPVYIENDTVLCGLGEAHYGAGSKTGVMVYYTVSTGVNGVRLVNGAVDPTISRFEMGYQIVDAVSAKMRSLESFAGGAALEKRLGKAPKDVKDKTVWSSVERYMAAGLYNTALYWNPSVIVVGGKMMRDLRLEEIERILNDFPKVHEAWPVLKNAECGDEAGVRGAMVWLEQHGHK